MLIVVVQPKEIFQVQLFEMLKKEFQVVNHLLDHNIHENFEKPRNKPLSSNLRFGMVV